MARGRVESLDTAAARVPDGAMVYLGGAVLRDKPVAFCRTLVARGARGLDVVAFTGSVDVELLLAGQAVDTVRSAYVGLGEHGLAPRFRAGARDGSFTDLEYSEWTLLLGLRAAATGAPFLPTRAEIPSRLALQLGMRNVRDPYRGGEYLAVPPLVPDVAVLHAWRASESGDVQFSSPPEHLWDVDVLAARAAKATVVTVEEIVPDVAIADTLERTRLFSFDVDAIVVEPAGAWPTATPPLREADHEALAKYAASEGDVSILDEGAPR